MQLSFDPRDRNACTSVIATIAALHGSLPFDEANANGAFGYRLEVRGDTDLRMPTLEGVAQADRLLEPDAPDPAEAFAGGASAEQAFGAAPLVPTASPSPSPANAATSPATAPAGTQGDGTAAPAASDTGPTATTGSAASPSNPGGVEVDANGLPWDGRIHSGPADKKPKNGDGTWRKKRGVDDSTVAAVEGELRAALGAPAAIVPVAPVTEAPAAPVPPPPPVAAAAPVPASPTPAPVAAAPAPAPVAPQPTPAPAGTASGPAAVTTVAETGNAAPAAATPAPPSPAPSPAAPASNFAELMRKITGLQAAGTLTVEGTAEISAALGISGVRDLITRPDLVPSFDALLPVAP